VPNIFDRRASFKPFEYPDLCRFKDEINHSYWLVSEWNFISDLDDFKVRLDGPQRNAIKNALLAISQIEVAVKRFWADLGKHLPKPEIDQVGITYSESEVRHADAYSRLLEVLGLDDEFSRLLMNPVIQGRVDYLSKYLKGASENSREGFVLTLTLFSIFIENVSLFSQFAVIKSFNKHLNVLKDIDNVVQATAKEELLHALFGARLISIIREENPGWFGPEFSAKLRRACLKAFDAEAKIIDWIFEAGEMPFLTAASLKEFVRKRFNDSLQLLGEPPAFAVDAALLAPLKWFDEEVHAESNTDFFHKKPVTYSKFNKPVTAEDLF
jgi:ribonucleoside-diphosphate reductase beta chain